MVQRQYYLRLMGTCDKPSTIFKPPILDLFLVNAENVFKVCDQPHPAVVQRILLDCQQGKIRSAEKELRKTLWDKGYSAMDILATMFKVVKNHNSMAEYIKLEFLKEIGFAHKQALDGCESFVQLSGLLAKLCKVSKSAQLSQSS